MQKRYTEKNFDLNHIEELSERQISAHLGLYAGYVKNTNLLLDKIETLRDSEAGPEISELTRRFGFEFNGMRLHEYYFDQLSVKTESATNNLRQALEAQYGSFENWLNDFKRVGMLRGTGWVLLVEDELNGNLFNIWVNDHELGHLGNQKIILAMDLWEHAFLLDFLPSERKNYIEVFFNNLNWSILENRFNQ
jgi:Fe-Mn family superoxide dismutase